MEPGLCLCSGLPIELFQAAHMRRKPAFRCGPQELSAFAKIFRRLALYQKNQHQCSMGSLQDVTWKLQKINQLFGENISVAPST